MKETYTRRETLVGAAAAAAALSGVSAATFIGLGGRSSGIEKQSGSSGITPVALEPKPERAPVPEKPTTLLVNISSGTPLSEAKPTSTPQE